MISVTAARKQLRDAIKARNAKLLAPNRFLSFGKDYLGADIKVGATVAYNRSGNVEKGTVVEVRRIAVPHSFNGGNIIHPKAGDCRIRNVKDKEISSVRWPASILVISSIDISRQMF